MAGRRFDVVIRSFGGRPRTVQPWERWVHDSHNVYYGTKRRPLAANALHGALLVGNRHAIAPRKGAWRHELASFGVELYCDQKLSQTGGGAFVLDSPLLALLHLVELLADDPHNPPLRAGELISTGTLTLAMPVSAGETWTTRVAGISLEDITLRFEA